MLAEKLGFSVCIDDWHSAMIEQLQAQGKSVHTIHAYISDMGVFSRWFERQNGEPFSPDQLNGVDLRGFRRSSLDDERCTPATWNRRLASLRVLVDFALAGGLISYDPLRGVEKADQVKLAPRWLKKEELNRVLRRCEINVNGSGNSEKTIAIRDQAMIYLMAYAGLRESEVCALDLEDVEIHERSGKVMVWHGKGGKRRVVPLAREARRAIGLWLERRDHSDTNALFTAGKGGGDRIGVRTVQRRVAEIGRQVGLELSPHDLRHTMAKRALDEGAPLTVVSELLGHARLETTARYVQPGWGDLEEAVERI